MTAGSTCPDPPVLTQLVLGRLQGPDVTQLEEHLAVCPRCVAHLQSLAGDDDLVRALRPPLRPEEMARRHLAEAVIPLLQRLRPRNRFLPPAADAPTCPDTGPPPSGGPVLAPFQFLAPAQGADEIGRLGPFRVLGVLGSGGMGVVFRAEDPGLKRPIALKVIRSERLAAPETRARFVREGQALAALEHDHVVTVYQVGEEDGVPFLAMPLLRGQTLQQRLAQAGGPLPIDTLLHLGRQIALGLAVAHTRGFIHRDVKPGNIWLEPDPDPAAGVAEGLSERVRARILDFGLAHALCGDQEGGGARPGPLLGTPAYMAPEQARGQAVDGRADLFSLGCVLYQMATGRAPFQAADPFRLLVSVAVDEPPLPRRLNPKVPAALERLIRQLMSKKVESRPPTAQAVALALQALAESRRAQRSRRRWLLGTGTIVLAAAALAAWGTGSRSADPGQVTFDYGETDGRIALRHGDETERAVDVRREKTVALPPGDHTVRPVAAVEKRRLWPNRFVVKSGKKRTVHLRLIGEVARHQVHELPVRGLAVCPGRDGPLVLSVSEDRTLVAWRPGKKPQTCWHRDSPLRCIALAPGAKTVATGSGDIGPRAVQVIRTWDVAALKQRPGDRVCRSQVNVLAYSPDGKWLLSGENDGSLVLWDVRVPAVEAEEPKAHGALGVFALAFLPDGKHVLTAGGDGAVVKRAIADLKPAQTLRGHRKPVHGLAVLPGGKQAVSAGLDGTIRLWDLATGKPNKWTVPAAVEALAVSPDEARLLTGDEAGGVRLWNLATREQVVEFSGSAAAVRAVAFTPDGRRGVSGGSDGVVRLWELPR
jgi:anti-sigma factor RsiW